MSKPSVVVLSSHTLFVEGVTRRLQARSDSLDLSVVDSHSPTAREQIIALAPETVIVDASDPEANRNCPIAQLLAALPGLKIIRLDPEHAGFQVVTSARHTAAEVGDLLEEIIGTEAGS